MTTPPASRPLRSRFALGALVGVFLAGCTGEPAPERGGVEKPLRAADDGQPAETTAESTPAPEGVSGVVSEPEPAGGEPEPSESLPTFGVAFTPPAGWRAEPALPRIGFVGRWLPGNDDPDDWSQFAIDLNPLVGSAEERAQRYRQAIARFERLGYRRSDFELDGVEAVRLDAPPLPPGAERRPVPSPILMTRRSRILYRTLYLLNDPEQTAEVDQLIEDWRWIEPTPVVEHLGLSEPQSLFEGLGTIRVPAISRVDAEFKSEDAIGFTAYDYSKLQDAILLVCERDLKPDPPALSEHVISYSESIEDRAGLDRPIAFDRAEGRQDLYTSESIEGQFEVDGRTVSRLCRYAVWRPKTGAIIRVQAVINNEVFSTKEQLAAAVRAVDAVFKSCSRGRGDGVD
ncbi:hypothetical protein MalM25_35040 [Planctomycetes bacterium MalM25]|nr:hypothetical protein MalM25_35040 [Planctomycetes bacterium MalM25]